MDVWGITKKKRSVTWFTPDAKPSIVGLKLNASRICFKSVLSIPHSSVLRLNLDPRSAKTMLGCVRGVNVPELAAFVKETVTIV